MNAIDEIYALYVDDDKSHIIYVGRAACRFKRLTKHLQESKNGTSKKCVGIRRLLEDGHTVNVLLLELVDLCNCHGDEEDVWITNIRGAGCDTLLNGKAGDTERHMFISDETWETTPWDADAFKSGWEKGLVGCPASKVGKFINGILFVRTGWSELYFIHPVFGKHECFGFVWEKKVEKAILMMTKDSFDYNKMVDAYKKRI